MPFSPDKELPQPRQPSKPALKPPAARLTGDPTKHLQWDEGVIQEHNELRGSRMKIDEPDTPYAQYDSGAESDDSRRQKSPKTNKESISWDTLQTRLDSVAAVRENFPQQGPDDDDDDEGDGKRSEMRVLEFKEHRKRHYNEMELVKRFRQEHPDELEDDQEVNGDNEKNGDEADDES